jgi:predicted NodU family carbamoyl transferase
MFILGISCHFHDAASVLIDGQLIAAVEEERFSRVKRDCNFPRNAIQFCLDQGGIDSSDLSYLAFFEKLFRKLDRILMTFNLKGEPIVDSPANAPNTFAKSEMDYLVLEDVMVAKAENAVTH